MPCALTIAGSDSSGGAGIQADLKTFTVLGVYGASVITGITAQNTMGVRGVELVSEDMVRGQLEAVLEDLPIRAIKTGMLGSAGIVRTVADTLKHWPGIPLVIDPVMVSKSGHVLLESDAREAVLEHLCPMATVITPNLHEAGILAGMQVETPEDMMLAARRLAGFGPRYVVVKGGHLRGGRAADFVWDGNTGTFLWAPRVPTRHTHGTGCTFSAAIAAFLAMGDEIPRALRRAKSFITRAVTTAPGIGGGHGPVNQLCWLGQTCPEHVDGFNYTLLSDSDRDAAGDRDSNDKMRGKR
ncbi:MAG TPA: bifunctional hydroxymethylpyrimidine kinase/phosphomethylpyrimidine kinase [Clostridia bacterium]|nr:bifunctional hydroxymethylpyrimidine kinase/phosphomethylpyrimidine kinase [Clostridia bacterium]